MRLYEDIIIALQQPDPIMLVIADITGETLSLTNDVQRPYQAGTIVNRNYSLAGIKPQPPVDATPPGLSGTADTGSVRVSAATAGAVWIDGKDAGVSVKAGGSVTVPNISIGATSVSLKTADGWVFTGETRVEAGKAAAFSFSDRQQDFETKADGAGITIANYKGQGTSVIIPASVNGKNVTTIGGSAFNNCASLTSVTIPDSVTTIGEWAFSWCKSLSSVTIPDSVTAIGEDAFNGCSGLTSVTIPDSVTTIGGWAFAGCASLKTISVHPANQWYKAIDGVLFTKDGKTLHTYPAGKQQTAYRIPDSVTTIGEGVFGGCERLTSVTIPNSVTAIGEGAFWGCERLTSITIPNSVTSVGNNAFYGCGNLKPEVRADIEKRFGKEALYDK